jgi:hypothetical protein
MRLLRTNPTACWAELCSSAWRRSTLSLSIGALVALVACDGTGPKPLVLGRNASRPTGNAARFRPSLHEAPEQLVAADPRLPGFDVWELALEARHHDPATDQCAMAITRGTEIVRTLDATLDATRCRATWDGRDTDGALVPPGALTVEGALARSGAELARAAFPVEIVRLGIERVHLAGERIPLLYRKTGGLDDGWYEIGTTDAPWQIAPDSRESGGAPLELPDGSARPLPMPNDDVLSPPLDRNAPNGVEHDTFNHPTGFVAGSEVDVIVQLTSSIAGAPAGGEPSDAVEVRLVAPSGLEIVGDELFADGAAIQTRTLASPVPAVGRYDTSWSWSFEARRASGGTPGEWQPIPGTFTTTHRLYGFVAMPTLGSTSMPHRAWIDVVDTIAEWAGGESAEESAVLAAIVDGVYWTSGLRYDTARGASFYTQYTSAEFGGAVFFLQRYQDRAWGRTINCTDAASIVSAFANMIGIDARYHILTNRDDSGFDLNFIRAIGVEAFDDTPFDSGRGGFRYHAIVGSLDGLTWDATLAIDGDGDATTAPHTLALVQGMDPEQYLIALSSEHSMIQTTHDEKVRLR